MKFSSKCDEIFKKLCMFKDVNENNNVNVLNYVVKVFEVTKKDT